MDTAFAKDTLLKLLEYLGLPFDSVSLSEEEHVVRLEIVSSQASKIIGWHGETLNSIQHLLKSILRSKEGDGGPTVIVDVDGYRRDQEDRVKRIAEQKADFVRRTGNRVALAPMSPYFRRIVHIHVAESQQLQDLTTESTGDGDYRQVVLRLKEEKGYTHAKKAEDEELQPVIEDAGLENLDV